MILNSGLKEKKSNRHVYAVNEVDEVDADLNKKNFEASDKVRYYFP